MTVSWRVIPGWERFEVSSDGDVRRIETHTLCRLTRRLNGYLCVGLSRAGNSRHEKYRTFLVHALVLEAFMGPRPHGADACHGNGRRDDNRLVNLRWASRRENELDKFKHGTKFRGVQDPRSIGQGCVDRAMDLLHAGVSERTAAKWLGIGRSILRKYLTCTGCPIVTTPTQALIAIGADWNELP